MSQPSEDAAWIRARAAKVMHEKDVDYEEALAIAVEERVEWKERQRRKRGPERLLRVTLADLVKARGK